MKLALLVLGIAVLAAIGAVVFLIPALRGELIISPWLSLGPISVRWYGLLMALSLLVGFLLARKFAPRLDIASADIEQVLPWAVIGGFLGARFYHVIFSWAYYQAHFGEILQIWKGGLAIYGGLGGGVLGIVWYAARRQVSAEKILASMAVAAPLSQAIGRFGNFFNHEAFGRPTDLPWKMFVPAEFRPAGYLWEQYFHPTFLYEALWNIVVFAALYLVLRARPNPRLLLGSYLVLYSFGRFLIESWRVDSIFLFGWRLNQIVSALAVAIGVIIIFRSHVFDFQKNR